MLSDLWYIVSGLYGLWSIVSDPWFLVSDLWSMIYGLWFMVSDEIKYSSADCDNIIPYIIYKSLIIIYYAKNNNFVYCIISAYVKLGLCYISRGRSSSNFPFSIPLLHKSKLTAEWIGGYSEKMSAVHCSATVKQLLVYLPTK